MPFLGRSAGPDRPAGLGQDGEGDGPWGRERYVPSAEARGLSRRSRQSGASAVTERQRCANPECVRAWTLPWRNRRRPVFEDRWGCSTACLTAMIQRTLRRERGDRHVALEEDGPHRHRVPLGLVMLGQGWITQVQLRAALAAQRAAGEGRVGEWLMRECGVSAGQVTRGLAAQWSCPVLPMDGFSPAAMALVMPRLLVEELGLVPLRVAGSRILYLAFKDRLNAAAALAMEQMTGLEVVSGLLDDMQFDGARERLMESGFAQADEQFVADTDALTERIRSVLEAMQPVGSRIVRVHQRYWLRLWLEAGAYSGTGRLPATGEDVKDIVLTIGSQCSGSGARALTPHPAAVYGEHGAGDVVAGG